MTDNSNETVQVDDGAVVHTSESEVASETQTTTVISPEAQALLDKIVSILTVNFNRKIAGSVLTADMYNKMNDMLIEAVNQHDASIQALKEYILTYVPNFVKIHISDSAEESTGDITGGVLVIDVSHLLDSLLDNVRKECKEYTNEQRKETETELKGYTNEYVKQYVKDALIKAGLPIEALTKEEIDAIFSALIIPDDPSKATNPLSEGYISSIGYFDMDTFSIAKEATINIYNTDNTENVMFSWACFEKKSSSEIIGNIYAQQGDIILATISARSELTLPDNLTLLHTSETFGEHHQTMSFAWMRVETTGEQTFTIHQAEEARFYLNLIALKNAKAVVYDGTHYAISPSNNVTSSNTLVPNGKASDEILIWGCSANLWSTSSPYREWQISNEETTIICLDPKNTQPRQANFIDAIEDDGQRSFYPDPNSTGSPCVVDAVKIIY